MFTNFHKTKTMTTSQIIKVDWFTKNWVSIHAVLAISIFFKIRHTVLANEVVWEIAVLEGIWAATGIEREVGTLDVAGG